MKEQQISNARVRRFIDANACFKYLTLFSFVLALSVPNGCSISSIYVKNQYSGMVSEKISDSTIGQSVFLIGDSGEQTEGMEEPVLACLKKEASKNSAQNTIVFLGDNIYPNGMPEVSNPQRALAEQRLTEETRVIEQSGAVGIFIPGNHDWGEWGDDGVSSIKRQNEFIAAKRNPNLQMSPLGGFPGPGILDIGERVRLVTLDTEWWLHHAPKPLYPGALSEAQTKKAVLDSLSKAFKGAGNRYVVAVGHHPLDSHGEHSGFFDWKDHLFPLRNVAPWLWLPLPGIGSIYPFLRNHGLSNQDFSSSAYQEMKRDFEDLFSITPPLVYASGHEHTLEVLMSSGKYLDLVSGFGTSKHDPSLTYGDNTIFAHRHPGFMRLDILREGRVRLRVIEPMNDLGEPAEVLSMWVK